MFNMLVALCYIADLCVQPSMATLPVDIDQIH